MRDLRPYLDFAWYVVKANKFTFIMYAILAVLVLTLDFAGVK
jgi:hypothetical protein